MTGVDGERVGVEGSTGRVTMEKGGFQHWVWSCVKGDHRATMERGWLGGSVKSNNGAGT